jgi:hypothetical protein
MKVSKIRRRIVLDARGVFGCIVRDMKLNFLAVLAGATLVITGCVRTATDNHAFATTWSKDNIVSRYNRSADQVYSAAVKVVINNGAVTREFITPTTNTLGAVRSFSAKVNQKEVWVRVSPVTVQDATLEVQARSSWGVSDVDLAAYIDKQVALQLMNGH